MAKTRSKIEKFMSKIMPNYRLNTRPPSFTDEPYLSAQVNASTSLPVHKDKNNHSFTWLIAFGNFLPVADYGLSRLLALIRHQTQGTLWSGS